jgi:uncharacterized phage protein (TIGR02218 family)
MKSVSPEFLAMVQSEAQLVEADLYTITLASGVVMYFTSAQENIQYDGNTYLAANTQGMGELLQNSGFTKNTSGTPMDVPLASNASASDDWTVVTLDSGHQILYDAGEAILIRLKGGSSVPASGLLLSDVVSPVQTVTPGAPFTLEVIASANNNAALPSGVTVILRTCINWLTAAGTVISTTVLDVDGQNNPLNTWPYTASGTAPLSAFFAVVILQGICTNANGSATTVGSAGQLPADLRWYNVQLTQYSVPGFHRGTWRCTRGLDSDELEIDILYDGNTRLLGQTPGAFANAGGFDQAQVRLDKALAPNWENPVINGVVNCFVGIVGEVKAGSSKVALTVNNNLLYLNQSFPTNYFLPQCNHALFDGGCGLNPLTYKINGTVTAAGGAPSVLAFSTNLSQADGWFSLGYLVWLTGANEGIQCSIATFYNANGQTQLIYPLSIMPEVGDTFAAYPGCDKVLTTCQSKFDNQANFRGYPFVPTPETLEVGGTGSTPVTPVGGNGSAGISNLARGPGGQTTAFKLT